ncbi:CopG family transcriptional regulator [Novosphingobium sp. PC22D]|uniref:ribbon-helix-helix protein, CopG family n=1 Tax=Novosphingobium sp. PC22D TaxID=1962403 RepID=UPI000BF0BCFC|nr:ribbon-helix-helix protein, CopG family [Novosphingobium sp. PC22D]PEQ12583.1 CopG family transcriptional regulator [Novosphingobium sp. PC22D]
MTDTVLISVRLPQPIAEAAKAVAEAQKTSRSNLVRIALEHFLEGVAGASELDRRRQFSLEYLFLALDLIIQRQYADVHGELLAEAEARMEALCGAA